MGSHIFGFLGVRQFFIFTVGSFRKNIEKGLSWDHENYIFAQK